MTFIYRSRCSNLSSVQSKSLKDIPFGNPPITSLLVSGGGLHWLGQLNSSRKPQPLVELAVTPRIEAFSDQ